MFGVVLTPPVSRDAQYGLLFMDAGGYLDMCGHSIMAVATALIEIGMVPPAGAETTLIFDTPAGRVSALARIEDDRVAEVSVANVPSFLYAADVTIDLPELGQIQVDVAFGGNFFALVDAATWGILIHPDRAGQLVELGMMIKQAVNARLRVRHPTHEHIETVELVEIFRRSDPSRPSAKSAIVFGEGQLDRCPCGTGTSAAMAALFARGRLKLGEDYINEGSPGPGSEGDSCGRSNLVTGSRWSRW
jgi:proline racemase/trans-L-3-hydroxyproline dehydratase